MPIDKNRIHRYTNAIRVKLPDRSLTAEIRPDGSYWLDIRRTLSPEERIAEEEPPVIYTQLRGRVGKLTIGLSAEAMMALMVLCQEVQRSRLVAVKEEAPQ